MDIQNEVIKKKLYEKLFTIIKNIKSCIDRHNLNTIVFGGASELKIDIDVLDITLSILLDHPSLNEIDIDFIEKKLLDVLRDCEININDKIDILYKEVRYRLSHFTIC